MMMKRTIIIALLVLLIVGLFPHASIAKTFNHSSPKKANYFLSWDLSEVQARDLAKWDVVILDMEIQLKRPELLRKMREWNPNIILLVYITPQEIRRDASGSYSQMRQRLAAKIPEAWYLHNTQGERLGWWPGTWVLNVTEKCPTVNGQTLNQTIVRFVTDDLLSTGYWDGVFYDNAWDNVSHFVGTNVDVNRDGVLDTTADSDWQKGMKKIYEDTRRATNGQYLIVGNGTTRVYADVLNGMMLENFLPTAWTPTMQTYRYNQQTTPVTQLNIINANTANRGGQNSYQQMRFGLASALMENGYYSFDYGDQDHGQTWRYDEYDVNLGNPTGSSQSVSGQAHYQSGVWTRGFDHGLAVVNSSPTAQPVSLGGEYEKIRGVQDPKMNDGSIISEVTVPANDGMILLKTFTVPNDVVFTNGSFARFFHPSGERARNGIFLFEEGYKGGDTIAHIDLNGNGVRDVLVASGANLSVWRDDGQPYLSVFPYTANYKGSLRVALGDATGDSFPEIFVAPSDGYPAPIKVYSRFGELVKDEWFPYGKTYKGGYSLALGNVEGDEKEEIIVGAGKTRQPTVTLFGGNYTRLREWLGFEKTFRGGVSVAAGNLDGSGFEEIVVGAGPGKSPIIRVFDAKGKQLYKEFTAYTTRGKPGIEVTTTDVDFDGNDEILATSNDVGI